MEEVRIEGRAPKLIEAMLVLSYNHVSAASKSLRLEG